MATLVLSAAGGAVGSAFGGGAFGLSAALLGRAAGATVGRMIDQTILGAGAQAVETARVERLLVTGASEGAAIGRVWGRMRVAGQVIWASRFRETSTASGGGKGPPKPPEVTEYSYDVSLAIALCEGPIRGVGRVWADGVEVAPEDLGMRVYLGGEIQAPDPKIVAVEAEAPAYRGTAYVVFEDLPLGPYGNRVPNFTFEVIRSVASRDPDRPDLQRAVEGVALMPGTGEYALATTRVNYEAEPGVTRPANVHTPRGGTDMAVSLAALRRELPNVRSATLIVSWFGDDLRCGQCSVVPKVEQREVDGAEMPWAVSGVTRAEAGTIAQIDGRPVYGGTPSDTSVVEAIGALRDRGIGTVFYPFLLMEQMAGNALPDPWTGKTGQPPFPWRGRITLSQAPGQPGSPDRSTAAADQVAAFMGAAQPGDFAVDGTSVRYTGPEDGGYRRFILHYAHLCAAAGGVEAFCIGSEMRSLTQIRSVGDAFPAVAAFRRLAGEVRAILGPGTKIGYAADWSEYFGYHPQDASGDVYFHLDPLWADDAIDFVGIDNYMRLSDWRDGDDHADAGWGSIYNLGYLRANVAGGEGFDWYYRDDAARDVQDRTPITDGAHDEAWVYRYKDLRAWWSTPHHERRGGTRSAEPTGWRPRSKPIWFTEYGCPAVDKGTNEPNVFYDPKSSESALPLHSSGTRDDLIQLQYLRATLSHWADADNNPVSDVYGGRMVDLSRAHVWAWDARPFPTFPADLATWSDGGNYRLGHWINGRATNLPLDLVVEAVAREAGVRDVDVSALWGLVRGYVQGGIDSARAALQPLMLALAFDAVERDGRIVFRSRTGRVTEALGAGAIAAAEAPGHDVEVARASESEAAGRLRLSFVDAEGAYATLSEEAVHPGEESRGVAGSDMPLVLTRAEGRAVVERWLSEARIARETARWAMPQSARPVGAGDVVTLPGSPARYRIDRMDATDRLEVEAVRVEPDVYRTGPLSEVAATATSYTPPGPVLPVFLDLPFLTGDEVPHAPHLAVTAQPWTGRAACWASDDGESFALDTTLTRPATIGRLLTPLGPGAPGRIDRQPPIRIRLISGGLASAGFDGVLAGTNAVALGDGARPWEVIQFTHARLTDPNVYEIWGLLRGQAGTDGIAPDSWPEGARVVLIDGALRQIGLPASARGRARIYRVGPAAAGYASPLAREVTAAFEGVGLRPYAPAHLRSRWDGNDLHLSWIRRTRIDGDGWGAGDVPLGEARELYRVRVIDGASVPRTVEPTVSAWTYAAADRAADGVGRRFAVEVAQISDRYGPGPFRRIEIDG